MLTCNCTPDEGGHLITCALVIEHIFIDKMRQLMQLDAQLRALDPGRPKLFRLVYEFEEENEKEEQ